MVGLWAEREVPKMSKPMMDHFSMVLDLVSHAMFDFVKPMTYATHMAIHVADTCVSVSVWMHLPPHLPCLKY
jgi:hypothetical protein